eukprot:TRINITY_DN1102_c0_g1_i1.p1 TRINITY_DN1102_c0_g1~~TRINITY_DN1102_c0_g1_i1.p1  ORF type:complete len:375 (+),score=33.57 TRINITY_DN1102_c0_g1_i1:151-1275(+)
MPSAEVLESLRATKLCKFHMIGCCNRGKACSFAHNVAELQEPPDLVGTRLCAQFKWQGRCKDGNACRFAHGQKELRKIPESSALQATRGSSQASEIEMLEQQLEFLKKQNQELAKTLTGPGRCLENLTTTGMNINSDVSMGGYNMNSFAPPMADAHAQASGAPLQSSNRYDPPMMPRAMTDPHREACGAPPLPPNMYDPPMESRARTDPHTEACGAPPLPPSGYAPPAISRTMTYPHAEACGSHSRNMYDPPMVSRARTDPHTEACGAPPLPPSGYAPPMTSRARTDPYPEAYASRPTLQQRPYGPHMASRAMTTPEQVLKPDTRSFVTPQLRSYSTVSTDVTAVEELHPALWPWPKEFREESDKEEGDISLIL